MKKYAILVLFLISGGIAQAQQCVPDNTTACPAGEVSIGGSVSITLAGTANDFTLTYNGTTYDNIPAGAFNLPNIVGNATTFSVTANCLDAGGAPVTDVINCTLNYAVPTCDTITQSPDTTVTPVDIGTVITLSLQTTGAIAATISGVPLTATTGTPNTDNTIAWEATHTAVADTTVVATITNPDGETTNCNFPIDVIEAVDLSPQQIPTLSEWGLIILGGTMGLMVLLRRRLSRQA